MRGAYQLMALLVSLVMLTSCSQASRLIVEESWARPGGVDGNSAVYFIINNATSTSDTLLGAASGVAASVEIHESKMDENGTMMMSPVSSVEVGPGSQQEFKAGGLHVMLIGLKQGLQPGDEFDLTLEFENAGEVPVTVAVREP